MFCTNCGSEQSENTALCTNCGAPIEQRPSMGEDDASRRHERQSPTISGDQNGTLSWVYEYSFWKNPTILLTVWKVMLIASLAPGLLIFFVTLGDGIGEAVKGALMVFGIGAGVMTVLLLIAYPITAFIYGGKYCVLFKMNEKGVDHIQLKKQFKKAQAVGMVAVVLGLMGNNPTVAGAGLMSATRQSMYTDFRKVKSVKICEKRHTIYLNETLKRNQIYAEPEDFPKIRDYILGYCPKNARIKG